MAANQGRPPDDSKCHYSYMLRANLRRQSSDASPPAREHGGFLRLLSLPVPSRYRPRAAAPDMGAQVSDVICRKSWRSTEWISRPARLQRDNPGNA
jgi:hypothetical protein